MANNRKFFTLSQLVHDGINGKALGLVKDLKVKKITDYFIEVFIIAARWMDE